MRRLTKNLVPSKTLPSLKIALEPTLAPAHDRRSNSHSGQPKRGGHDPQERERCTGTSRLAVHLEDVLHVPR